MIAWYPIVIVTLLIINTVLLLLNLFIMIHNKQSEQTQGNTVTSILDTPLINNNNINQTNTAKLSNQPTGELIYTNQPDNNSDLKPSSLPESSRSELPNPFNLFSSPDISIDSSESGANNPPGGSENSVENDNDTVSASINLSELCLCEEALSCSTNLFMFIQTRLEELKLDFSQAGEGEIIQWALSAVDFLDELKMMEKSYSQSDITFVEIIKKELGEIFNQNGISLIDLDVWDSTQQKAVSVVRKSDIQCEIITGKQSTGVLHNSQLIRKQEVYLEIPEKAIGE